MNSSAPGPPETEAVEVESKASSELHPAVRFVCMIVAAMVATALGISAIASVGDLYPTPPEVLNLGGRPTEEELAASRTAQQAADTGNAMVWLGICGSVLGGGFALSNGVLRQAGKNIAFGAVAGILAGGALGALSGKLAVDYNVSVFQSLRDPTTNSNTASSRSSAEQQFMIMHGITWGLIGAGVGLGCGLSRSTIETRQIVQLVIVAGVMGSIAGGLYPIVAGIVDPLVSSARPVAPPGAARAVWVGLASTLMAVGVSRAG